jgi:hypothetical protein
MNNEYFTPPQDNNNNNVPDFSGYPVTDPDIFLSSQEDTERLVSKSDKHVSPEDIRRLVDSLASIQQYFIDVSVQAGRLAGEGDYIGALSILGSEQNARFLLEEYADEIITGAGEQLVEEIENQLDS